MSSPLMQSGGMSVTVRSSTRSLVVAEKLCDAVCYLEMLLSIRSCQELPGSHIMSVYIVILHLNIFFLLTLNDLEQILLL